MTWSMPAWSLLSLKLLPLPSSYRMSKVDRIKTILVKSCNALLSIAQSCDVPNTFWWTTVTTWSSCTVHSENMTAARQWRNKSVSDFIYQTCKKQSQWRQKVRHGTANGDCSSMLVRDRSIMNATRTSANSEHMNGTDTDCSASMKTNMDTGKTDLCNILKSEVLTRDKVTHSMLIHHDPVSDHCEGETQIQTKQRLS